MKIYKTALGKSIDLDQLILKNEQTIAVGNMKVNARGDELGPGGVIAKSKNDRVSEHYKINHKSPKDDEVYASAKDVPVFGTNTETESKINLTVDNFQNDLKKEMKDETVSVEAPMEESILTESSDKPLAAQPKKVDLNTKNQNTTGKRVRRIT